MSNMVINDLLVLDEMTESELSRVLGGIKRRGSTKTVKGFDVPNPDFKPWFIAGAAGGADNKDTEELQCQINPAAEMCGYN